MKTMGILLLVTASTALAATTHHLTYEEFISEVEAGNVQSVTMSEYSLISGTVIEDGQPKEFFTFTETGSVNDPLLNRLLDSHEVEISFKQTEKTFSDIFDVILGCMFIGFPFVIVILLIVILKKINTIKKYLQPSPDIDYQEPLSEYDNP